MAVGVRLGDQGCSSIIWAYLGQTSSVILRAGTLEKMQKSVKERL